MSGLTDGGVVVAADLEKGLGADAFNGNGLGLGHTHGHAYTHAAPAASAATTTHACLDQRRRTLVRRVQAFFWTGGFAHGERVFYDLAEFDAYLAAPLPPIPRAQRRGLRSLRRRLTRR